MIRHPDLYGASSQTRVHSGDTSPHADQDNPDNIHGKVFGVAVAVAGCQSAEVMAPRDHTKADTGFEMPSVNRLGETPISRGHELNA